MEEFIDQLEIFPFELIEWYRLNHRKLPWRDTRDPYKIWLSEIILQQTKVVQGQKYYEKFVRKYPEVGDLAMAAEEEVLKDWQGLGYYSRARNLHHTAQIIMGEHNGEFPNSFESIKKLKGVGDYTAAAISSFAFDQAHAVVDGNVYRLLSRYFGIETPIDSGKGKKEFAELAQKLLPKDNAAEYNQAIMEFGALQCIPASPDCNACPINTSCSAFATEKVNQLPIKSKKLKVKHRWLHYLIISDRENIILNKREQKGIWQNLFDFPSIEKSSLLDWNELQQTDEFNTLVKASEMSFEGESEERKHLLSHQTLHCKFYHLTFTKIDSRLRDEYYLISLEKLADYPIPKLIENYLGEETNLLSLFGN